MKIFFYMLPFDIYRQLVAGNLEIHTESLIVTIQIGRVALLCPDLACQNLAEGSVTVPVQEIEPHDRIRLVGCRVAVRHDETNR